MEFRHFATFARDFEPQNYRLYLVGCGPNGNDARWTRGFMDTLAGGRMPEGYSFHYYENGILPPEEFTPQAMYTQFNIFPRVEQAIVQQRNLLDTYDPNRRMGLILDEWGVWDRIPQADRADQRAAVAAIDDAQRRGGGARTEHLQPPGRQALHVQHRADGERAAIDSAHRRTGRQELRSHHQLSTLSCCSSRIAGKRRCGSRRMATRSPPRPLAAAVDGAAAPQQEDPPDLSVSASRQGGEMVVTFVNPRHDVDMDVDCAIRGVTAHAKARRRSCTTPISTLSTASSSPTGSRSSRTKRPSKAAASGSRCRRCRLPL